MTDTRPRRSLLFMPSSNARALEKAKTLACDGVIFDLEDAVAPDAKQMAREQAAAAVASGAYGARERIVRINGLDTPWWRDDVKAAAEAGVGTILIPKVEAGATLTEVEAELALYEGGDAVRLWAMMETPFGFLHAEEILMASERLDCIVVGTNDLIKDLRARHVKGRMPVMTALGIALLAARAHGRMILDGVYGDFRDDEGFREECLQARDMGFDGKSLIHPSQIATANAAFGPDADDLAYARRLIEAFETTAEGVAVLDGRMIEELHVTEARRLVAMAEAIAKLEAGD